MQIMARIPMNKGANLNVRSVTVTENKNQTQNIRTRKNSQTN